MLPPPPRDRRGFEIALICALRIEAEAVHTIFDRFWDEEGKNYGQAPGDNNSYTTGVIGAHNVVLAYMPGMGKANAAAVSTSLRHSFPSIKLALVVGICGVIPYDESHNAQIYLGDLIISTALVQYDFGGQYPVVFKKKDTLEDGLGRPTSKLRSLLNKFQTRRYHRKLQSDIAATLDDIEQIMPDVRYPGPECDQLYDSTYTHQHRPSNTDNVCAVCSQNPPQLCSEAVKASCTELQCDVTMCARRRHLAEPQSSYLPAVHFGRMASGDTVMKSGSHRDEIAKRDRIIALEMEGAGVWDQLPSCIILKSACDYADSHKNKDWQSRAAAVAAAGAKAFLVEWSPDDSFAVDDSSHFASVYTVDTIDRDQDRQLAKRRRINGHDEHAFRPSHHEPGPDISDHDDNEIKAIMASLAFHHMFTRKHDIEIEHHQTCKWLLDLPEYQNWWTRKSGLLWIKGKPGAGKSTLMLFLYKTLRREHDFDRHINLEFFFTARGDRLQRDPMGMLRSLLNQLFQQDTSIRRLVRKSYREKQSAFGAAKESWVWQRRELENLLLEAVLMSARRKPVNIFIDALDEAGEKAAREMAHYFHNINGRVSDAAAACKICISCRHYPIVTRVPGIEVCVEDHNENDIKAFVHDRLHTQNFSTGDAAPSTLWSSFADELVERAHGVFMWVCLVVPMVEKAIDDGDSPEATRQRLRQVPGELEDVYEYILNKVVSPQHWDASFLLFQWVSLAQHPLTLMEMWVALTTKDIGAQPVQSRSCDLQGLVINDDVIERQIRAWSGGLVEVIRYDEITWTSVRVVHQSVNDFLFSRGLATLMSLQTRSLSGIDPGESQPPQSQIVLQMCQGNLYRYCLSYFMTHDTRDALETIKSTELSVNRMTERDVICKYPFLDYVCDFLFIHAEKSVGRRGLDMVSEASLLDQVIDSWTEAHIFSRQYRNKHAYLHRGTKLIHAAVRANLEDLVEHIIRQRIVIDVQDDAGYTALHCAAQAGHLGLIQTLHSAGLSILAATTKHSTPLVLAAGKGHLDIVQWLLSQGASLEMSVTGSETALHAAANSGDTKMVQILLSAGADVNAQGGYYGTALQAASARGNESMVQMLLAHDADASARGGVCDTALQAAAAYINNENVVQLLLNCGVDVNAQGGKYGTALQAAAAHGSTNTVQILLDCGADVNAQGGYFGTALQGASAVKSGEDVVQMLLDRGADVNTRGGHFDTALKAASAYGNENVVRTLLAQGADADARGGYYGTALQAASACNSESIAQMLLDHGADVNAQGGYYGTALHAACCHGENVIQMLLDGGADINARAGPHGTALQHATLWCRHQAVQTLLNAGAEPLPTSPNAGSEVSNTVSETTG